MEQANQPAEPANPELSRKPNRGRFRRADPRINRAGRGLYREPSVAEKVEAWGGKGPCPACGMESAPKSGRLMQQILSEKELRQRLTMTTADSSYVVHLPDDAQILGIELDAERGVVVVTFRSEKFKPVAAGEPIRELDRAHFGQPPKWW
jgi:hypothetical protein